MPSTNAPWVGESGVHRRPIGKTREKITIRGGGGPLRRHKLASAQNRTNAVVSENGEKKTKNYLKGPGVTENEKTETKTLVCGLERWPWWDRRQEEQAKK